MHQRWAALQFLSWLPSSSDQGTLQMSQVKWGRDSSEREESPSGLISTKSKAMDGDAKVKTKEGTVPIALKGSGGALAAVAQ